MEDRAVTAKVAIAYLRLQLVVLRCDLPVEAWLFPAMLFYNGLSVFKAHRSPTCSVIGAANLGVGEF